MDSSHLPASSPPATGAPQRLSIGVIAIGLLLYALWGGNVVAIKFALTGFPPVGLAGLRFALAALGVAVWCACLREPWWPSRREVSALALNGTLFTVQIATFYLGMFWSTATHGAVLVNAFPIFVAIFAHVWLVGDRLNAGKAIGVALGFAGVVAIFFDRWGDQGTMMKGDAVLAVSAAICGFQMTYFKDAVARINPYKMTLWQMIICMTANLAYSLRFEDLLGARPDALVLVALAYQGIIVGAFSFSAWAVVLRRVAVSKMALFGFTTPLWGVVLSHLFLGEPLTRALLLGMALVAAGIAIAVRS